MSIPFNRTLAFRNKNPLNIRYSKSIKWQGQDGAQGGFVKFMDFYWGYRAAVKILRKYQQRGCYTIQGIISRWAPPSENQTDKYIKSVLDYMNCVFRLPSQGDAEYCARTRLNLKDREAVVNLLMAMTKVEMGANTAQLHDLRGSAEWGYDKAVTSPNFFEGIS